ncbi:unnamed protein product [Brassica oleracea]|uniref:(rape) hypothetical protein n=1 Tax=Brassica napus TaxID=3708 RepID=A0A816JYU7_BRANA|nr:unnamed protein product [Brassica napus]
MLEQGRCVGSFSGLVSSLLQPLLSFSQCSVFLVDDGCPARSGECTSSLWERSLVVSISSFVFLCSIQFVVVSVNCGPAIFCVVLLRTPTKQRLIFLSPS